ncbi:MAG: Rieske (2Fe-2S) protein [Bacteroidetes bacterium]|nr:Rieske (2Fe-2S) protein [Bacteroidota bacterium]
MEWIKIFENKEQAEEVLFENKPRLLIIREKRICLVKTTGKILAIQNNCTHNGGSLSRGSINFMGEVVCPLHQYQFNLKTGREAYQRSADLECFPIRESEEGVFIGLD